MHNKFYFFWYNTNVLIELLETIVKNSKKNETTLYTHNINFDGFLLIDFLKQTSIHFDWFSRDLNIYWIKIFYLKKTILIRCSYKIIPLSIEKLEYLMNLPKFIYLFKFVDPLHFNYDGPVPEIKYFDSQEDYNYFVSLNFNFNFKKHVFAYCKRNIIILEKTLRELISKIDLYNKKIIKSSFSFAAIAYKIYSSQFDPYSITQTKIKKTDWNYFKNAYYGGRCEVFGNPQKGEIIHYFDFVGMYGQCMLEKFPTGSAIFKEKNLNYKNIGFHTIRFKCDDYLPFLPFKSGKLYFPNGEIVGTYWYEEIMNAEKYKKCEIIEHYSSYEYETCDFVFTDFVNEFAALRKKGIYYDLFGKNIINGLYGSFALVEENYFTIIIQNEIEFDSLLKLTDVLKWKKIGNLFVLNIEKNHKSFYLFKNDNGSNKNSKRNIAYAAIIASKARIKLNKTLQKVLDLGGVLYYTDTDSVFAGFNSNQMNNDFNEIQWTDTYEDAVFVSNKFYQIKGKNLKLKGINSLDYDFSKLKTNFYNNDLFLNFEDQFSTYKKNYTLFFNYATKQINFASYDKRIFNETKKKTTPITVNNIFDRL